MVTVSKRIQELMEGAGLTKSELARACGLSPGAVTAWTQKDHPIDPPIRTLRKICAAVGTDLAGFFAPFKEKRCRER